MPRHKGGAEMEEGKERSAATKWSPPKGSLVSYLCCCCAAPQQQNTDYVGLRTDLEWECGEEVLQLKKKTKMAQKPQGPVKRGAVVPNKEIGCSCPVKFIWDYGGKDVYVCIFQNGCQKSVLMKKAAEGGHLEADVKLLPGRCEFRYAVDGFWRHDPELPALKNDHGHFNNMLKIKESREPFMIKKPNPDNLNSNRAEGQLSTKKRCLSGDETLILSSAEDVLSLNDTMLVFSEDNTFDDGNMSDDELQDLPLDDAAAPSNSVKSFLMTEVNLDLDPKHRALEMKNELLMAEQRDLCKAEIMQEGENNKKVIPSIETKLKPKAQISSQTNTDQQSTDQQNISLQSNTTDQMGKQDSENNAMALGSEPTEKNCKTLTVDEKDKSDEDSNKITNTVNSDISSPQHCNTETLQEKKHEVEENTTSTDTLAKSMLQQDESRLKNTDPNKEQKTLEKSTTNEISRNNDEKETEMPLKSENNTDSEKLEGDNLNILPRDDDVKINTEMLSNDKVEKNNESGNLEIENSNQPISEKSSKKETPEDNQPNIGIKELQYLEEQIECSLIENNTTDKVNSKDLTIFSTVDNNFAENVNKMKNAQKTTQMTTLTEEMVETGTQLNESSQPSVLVNSGEIYNRSQVLNNKPDLKLDNAPKCPETTLVPEPISLDLSKNKLDKYEDEKQKTPEGATKTVSSDDVSLVQTNSQEKSDQIKKSGNQEEIQEVEEEEIIAVKCYKTYDYYDLNKDKSSDKNISTQASFIDELGIEDVQQIIMPTFNLNDTSIIVEYAASTNGSLPIFKSEATNKNLMESSFGATGHNIKSSDNIQTNGTKDSLTDNPDIKKPISETVSPLLLDNSENITEQVETDKNIETEASSLAGDNNDEQTPKTSKNKDESDTLGIKYKYKDEKSFDLENQEEYKVTKCPDIDTDKNSSIKENDLAISFSVSDDNSLPDLVLIPISPDVNQETNTTVKEVEGSSESDGISHDLKLKQAALYKSSQIFNENISEPVNSEIIKSYTLDDDSNNCLEVNLTEDNLSNKIKNDSNTSLDIKCTEKVLPTSISVSTCDGVDQNKFHTTSHQDSKQGLDTSLDSNSSNSKVDPNVETPIFNGNEVIQDNLILTNLGGNFGTEEEARSSSSVIAHSQNNNEIALETSRQLQNENEVHREKQNCSAQDKLLKEDQTTNEDTTKQSLESGLSTANESDEITKQDSNVTHDSVDGCENNVLPQTEFFPQSVNSINYLENVDEPPKLEEVSKSGDQTTDRPENNKDESDLKVANLSNAHSLNDNTTFNNVSTLTRNDLQTSELNDNVNNKTSIHDNKVLSTVSTQSGLETQMAELHENRSEEPSTNCIMIDNNVSNQYGNEIHISELLENEKKEPSLNGNTVNYNVSPQSDFKTEMSGLLENLPKEPSVNGNTVDNNVSSECGIETQMSEILTNRSEEQNTNNNTNNNTIDDIVSSQTNSETQTSNLLESVNKETNINGNLVDNNDTTQSGIKTEIKEESKIQSDLVSAENVFSGGKDYQDDILTTQHDSKISQDSLVSNPQLEDAALVIDSFSGIEVSFDNSKPLVGELHLSGNIMKENSNQQTDILESNEQELGKIKDDLDSLEKEIIVDVTPITENISVEFESVANDEMKEDHVDHVEETIHENASDDNLTATTLPTEDVSNLNGSSEDQHQANGMSSYNLTANGGHEPKDSESSLEKVDGGETINLIDFAEDGKEVKKLERRRTSIKLKKTPSEHNLIHKKMGHVLGKSVSSVDVPRVKQEDILAGEILAGETPKDVFKEINRELISIQKSRSRSDMMVSQKLERSASKSKFLEEVKQKKKEVEEEKEKHKIQEEEDRKTQEGERKKEKERQRQQLEEEEEKRRKAEQSRSQVEETPKKMEEIFGPIREDSVYVSSVYIPSDYDPNHREIKGMSEDVRLKKTVKEKTVQQKAAPPETEKKKPKYSLPAKPATFQKPKPKVEEPPPPPPEEPKIPTPEPEVKQPTPPPPEPKLPTPQPVKMPTPEPVPIPREPSVELPPPPLEEDTRAMTPRLSPTKLLPPKVGINGFNTVGRLVLRAAFESGLDVVAVNDPFVPVNYMVYMLKFDIAHSHSIYHKKEMNVRESPTGQIVINGKIIHVFDEHDVSKIPWELAGVNYVVETSEALNNLAEAKQHLKSVQKGLRLRHLVEEEERRKIEPDLVPNANNSRASASEENDPYSLLRAGCRKVIIASPSPDAPLYSVGVNDCKVDPTEQVTSHVSAPTAALTPVLCVLQKEFGIKSCAYTLLKSIRGRSKDIKCQNLGPNSHSNSVKWDFTENLIPISTPKLEEETFRIMPGLRGKLHGMCVYVPTPEVSMFDLTVQLEKESETIYRDACLAIKEASGKPPLQSVLRYCMKMSDENSASSVFISESHSSIVDGKSGCQVSNNTIKLVVWFDNEFGFASRIVDLVTQAHMSYCQT